MDRLQQQRLDELRRPLLSPTPGSASSQNAPAAGAPAAEEGLSASVRELANARRLRMEAMESSLETLRPVHRRVDFLRQRADTIHERLTGLAGRPARLIGQPLRSLHEELMRIAQQAVQIVGVFLGAAPITPTPPVPRWLTCLCILCLPATQM